jgi:hypothetical protein
VVAFAFLARKKAVEEDSFWLESTREKKSRQFTQRCKLAKKKKIKNLIEQGLE